MISLILFEKYPTLSKVWISLVSSISDMEIVALVQDEREALSLLDRVEKKIDVILVPAYPDEGSFGVVTPIKLYQEFIQQKIIIYSILQVGAHIYDMWKKGIPGYIFMENQQKVIIEAIRKVAEGKIYYSEEAVSKRKKYEKYQTVIPDSEPYLTSLERRILMLLYKEYSCVEVSILMNMPEEVVNIYRDNIFTKFNTSSLAPIIKQLYANKEKAKYQ